MRVFHVFLRIPRTVHVVKPIVKPLKFRQSLAGESIAMREPCTILLHCPHSSKLKIFLLRMLLDCPRE